MYRVKKTKCWAVIEKAINDLIKNNDLEEKTSQAYIVGYHSAIFFIPDAYK